MSWPKHRSWLFLLLLSLLIIWAGQSLGERQGLLWALAIALGVNTLFFFFGEWRIAPLLNGAEVEGQDPYRLLDRLSYWSDKVRIPQPRLYIVHRETPQALAIGSRWSTGRIYLTDGLLNTFSSAELDAVIIYHLVSIRRLATLSLTLSSALADAVLLLTGLVDSVLRWIFGMRRRGSAMNQGVFTWTIAPFLALLMRIAVGRSEYFETDRLAASYCPDPKILAEVLWKLEGVAATQPLETPAFLAHLFMVSPLPPRGWKRFFRFQPAAPDRIRRLLGHFPI